MIKTLPCRSPTPATPAVCCAVAACGLAEARAADLPALRQQLAVTWADTLSVPLLRQADEQCLVALDALRQARDELARQGEAWADWPILAAPRYFGRAAMAATLERSRSDGPWGVSPHFVAQRSLHSLPGLLSLALKVQGPNLGIGGGPGAESEVFLTAATFLLAERVRGVWVVLSEWHPELAPTPQGEVPPDAVCRAIVLALTTSGSESGGFRLRFVCRQPGQGLPEDGPGFTLGALRAALRGGGPYATTWVWYLEHGLLELYWPGTPGRRGDDQAGRGMDHRSRGRHPPGARL